MVKKFSDLRAQMSPEAQARVEAKAQELLAEMPLNELRQACSGQPIPDSGLSFSSATAGGNPSLN